MESHILHFKPRAGENENVFQKFLRASKPNISNRKICRHQEKHDCKLHDEEFPAPTQACPEYLMRNEIWPIKKKKGGPTYIDACKFHLFSVYSEMFPFNQQNRSAG